MEQIIDTKSGSVRHETREAPVDNLGTPADTRAEFRLAQVARVFQDISNTNQVTFPEGLFRRLLELRAIDTLPTGEFNERWSKTDTYELKQKLQTLRSDHSKTTSEKERTEGEIHALEDRLKELERLSKLVDAQLVHTEIEIKSGWRHLRALNPWSTDYNALKARLEESSAGYVKEKAEKQISLHEAQKKRDELASHAEQLHWEITRDSNEVRTREYGRAEIQQFAPSNEGRVTLTEAGKVLRAKLSARSSNAADRNFEEVLAEEMAVEDALKLQFKKAEAIRSAARCDYRNYGDLGWASLHLSHLQTPPDVTAQKFSFIHDTLLSSLYGEPHKRTAVATLLTALPLSVDELKVKANEFFGDNWNRNDYWNWRKLHATLQFKGSVGTFEARCSELRREFGLTNYDNYERLALNELALKEGTPREIKERFDRVYQELSKARCYYTVETKVLALLIMDRPDTKRIIDGLKSFGQEYYGQTWNENGKYYLPALIGGFVEGADRTHIRELLSRSRNEVNERMGFYPEYSTAGAFCLPAILESAKSNSQRLAAQEASDDAAELSQLAEASFSDPSSYADLAAKLQEIEQAFVQAPDSRDEELRKFALDLINFDSYFMVDSKDEEIKRQRENRTRYGFGTSWDGSF